MKNQIIVNGYAFFRESYNGFDEGTRVFVHETDSASSLVNVVGDPILFWVPNENLRIDLRILMLISGGNLQSVLANVEAQYICVDEDNEECDINYAEELEPEDVDFFAQEGAFSNVFEASPKVVEKLKSLGW